MKIAYLIHRFPHLSETFILRELLELHARGVDIEVFSLMMPRSRAASPEVQKLLPSTHYCRTLSIAILATQFRVFLKSPLAYLSALAGVVRLTWREPRVLGLVLSLYPKAVHYAEMMRKRGVTHLHANFVWIEAVLADAIRRLVGIGYTVRPHAFGLFSRPRASVRLQLERANGIVTVSDYHRRYIQKMTPVLAQADIDVVHCGVNPAMWDVQAVGHHDFRILSIGRSVAKKGHRYLIDACSLLAEAGVEFQCNLVVGTGEGAKLLQAIVDAKGLRERVSLLPNQDEVGIRKLLASSDVFALAAVVAPNGDRDGIPVVLMEAMAARVPVVTTPIAGIPELVIDRVTGLLVPPENPEALANAIVELKEDRLFSSLLADRGRAKIEAEFDIEQTSEQMRQVFSRHS